ncbi:MAG: class I fructose-bisphosphate aldolase [Candidatus Paceibacterota bacterium]
MNEYHNKLCDVAEQLMTPGKGILAADESNSTAGKRLDSVGLENTEENRRRYRNLFLNTEGIGEYLSGVILYTETLEQKSDEGVLFPKLLDEKGIIPGVKVDLGTVPLPGFDGEVVTEGLDGLGDRLESYRDSGAGFTKWRAVITIGEDIPTPEAIHANAVILARYAKIAQERGYVPIVEPEVIYAGDHSFARSAAVTEAVLKEVCYQMDRFRVDCGTAIIKTSMVLPGRESGEEVEDKVIAEETVRVLKSAVSPEMAGVVFLSGGQEPDEATAHLNEIAKLEPLPFELAFSFARAIQQPVLDVWGGDDANLSAAREEFIQRLKNNTQADQGSFSE